MRAQLLARAPFGMRALAARRSGRVADRRELRRDVQGRFLDDPPDRAALRRPVAKLRRPQLAGREVDAPGRPAEALLVAAERHAPAAGAAARPVAFARVGGVIVMRDFGRARRRSRYTRPDAELSR